MDNSINHDGRRLRAARKTAGWSQHRMAAICGVSAQGISNCETGFLNIHPKWREKFNAALGITI